MAAIVTIIIGVGGTLTSVCYVIVHGIRSTVISATIRNRKNAMPFVPSPGVAQADVIQLMDGQRCENVFHYKKEGATDYNTADLTALATALLAYFGNATIKGLYPTTWQVVEVRCSDLSDEFGPAVTLTPGAAIIGTRAGAQLPNNCALVLTKRTPSRGRSFRGRMYFGPLTETDVTGNIVAAATVTSIVSNMQGLKDLTDAGAVHHYMQVLSFFMNGLPRPAGLATQVINLTSDGVIDSQRRRLPGRGS